MAKEPKQANAPKVEFDALAEKLVPDPATIADCVALAGFVGRSAEEGNVRLYVDAGFRSYYEISASDILHTQQLPTTQSPLGGSVVYVKGGAPLRRVQVSAEIEARFLQGPISSIGGASSLRGAGRAFPRRPFPTLFGVHCVSNAPTSCGDVGCRGRTGDGCGGDTDVGCDTDVLAGCGDTNFC
jgi:hypothetical protein